MVADPDLGPALCLQSPDTRILFPPLAHTSMCLLVVLSVDVRQASMENSLETRDFTWLGYMHMPLLAMHLAV